MVYAIPACEWLNTFVLQTRCAVYCYISWDFKGRSHRAKRKKSNCNLHVFVFASDLEKTDLWANQLLVWTVRKDTKLTLSVAKMIFTCYNAGYGYNSISWTFLTKKSGEVLVLHDFYDFSGVLRLSACSCSVIWRLFLTSLSDHCLLSPLCSLFLLLMMEIPFRYWNDNVLWAVLFWSYVYYQMALCFLIVANSCLLCK